MKYAFIILFLSTMAYAEWEAYNPLTTAMATNFVSYAIYTNRYDGETKTNVWGYGDVLVGTNNVTNIVTVARTEAKPYDGTLSVLNGILATNSDGRAALSILLWHQYAATNEYASLTNALNISLLSAIQDSTNDLDTTISARGYETSSVTNTLSDLLAMEILNRQTSGYVFASITNTLATQYVNTAGDTMTGSLALSNQSLHILTRITPTYTTNDLEVGYSGVPANYGSGTYIVTGAFQRIADYNGKPAWSKTISGPTFYLRFASGTYYIWYPTDVANTGAGWYLPGTTPIGSYLSHGGNYSAGSALPAITSFNITTNNANTVYTNTLSSTSSGQLQLNSEDIYGYTSLTNKLTQDGY